MDDDVGLDVGQQSDVRGGTINATLFNSMLNALTSLNFDASATAGFGSTLTVAVKRQSWSSEDGSS